MKNFSRWAGAAALAMACIYLGGFIYFGGFWAYPASATAVEQLSYLNQHQTGFALAMFSIYVPFGLLLAVLVTALQQQLAGQHPNAAQLSGLLGTVWVVLVIAAGMIAVSGLTYVLGASELTDAEAIATWQLIGQLVDAIGGGNEVVSGVWVLLVSALALKARLFAPAIHYLGLVVGVAGTASVLPMEIFAVIFGLSQIIWFTAIGVALLRNPQVTAGQ